jgi:hypothetical protein
MRDRLVRLRSALLADARRVRDWVWNAWRHPARRERVKATAAFAFIVAFTAGSIDYLITGGPDWNPGGEAYAMEAPQPRVLAAAAPATLSLPAPPGLTPAAPLEIDYSWTSEELLGGPDAAAPVIFADAGVGFIAKPLAAAEPSTASLAPKAPRY